MSSFDYPQYSEKIERDIYERWLKKCQEETNAKRQLTERNIFKKIQDDREILNRLGPIPQSEQYSKVNEHQKHSIPISRSAGQLPSISENKYDLYTLDGYPRHNYLGFYMNQPQLSNSISNGYGIKRGATEITNSEVYDKTNNLTYDEYKAKQKEFLNFNQHTINDNIRYRDYLFNEKRRINEERLREIQRLRELEFQERQLENEKKKIYKGLLDDQLKIKIPSKLGEEYYSANFYDKAVKFNNPKLYLTTPENSFINRNRLVEVNPYSLKRTELGNTLLPHNPILNPVFDYKYNKYLFPQTDSTFRNVGMSVAK